MSFRLQLEYWRDGQWFVGRLPQVPGLFSHSATLEELEENIRDAYRLMMVEQETVPVIGSIETKEVEFSV